MLNVTLFSRIMAFAVILFALPACRTMETYPPSAHVSVSAYSYYYYPDAEVYFDTNRHSYFYFSNGFWRVSANLPNALRLHLGSHVPLQMHTAEPYHEHPTHRKHYPRGYFKHKPVPNNNRGRVNGHDNDREHDNRRPPESLPNQHRSQHQGKEQSRNHSGRDEHKEPVMDKRSEKEKKKAHKKEQQNSKYKNDKNKKHKKEKNEDRDKDQRNESGSDRDKERDRNYRR